MMTTASDTKETGMKKQTTVRIKTDKRGRPIAHKWGVLAMRWLPISPDTAYLMIATGEARRAA